MNIRSVGIHRNVIKTLPAVYYEFQGIKFALKDTDYTYPCYIHVSNGAFFCILSVETPLRSEHEH